MNKNKLSCLVFAVMLLLSIAGCRNEAVIDHFGGGLSDGDPDMMQSGLSPEARELVEKAYEPYRNNQHVIADYHVHIVGANNNGAGDFCSDANKSGIYLNSKRFQLSHAISYIKTKVLMSASKIKNLDKADEQYARRLLNLAKNVPVKTQFHILAMDGYWEKVESSGGGVKTVFNKEKTDLYVPNEYVVKLAKCLNDKLGEERFVPVISVHPYRPNAVGLLEEYHKQGIRFVKWLPNVMNIDPRIKDKEYAAFYKKMHELGMVLISHTGFEEATHPADERHQVYGFPAFLENALDAGVTVIMAHSGGDNRVKYNGKLSHESFLDMVEKASQKPEWKLYADISALTIDKNIDHFSNIIGNEKLKGKMLYGSDYPLPATYFLYPVDELIKKGYLDKDLKEPLKEIFKYNPLVFDFVLKRNIKHPKTGEKLPVEVFEINKLL